MRTIIFPIIGFILGIILGSLSKALADRSLTSKSFLGRSICMHCQHQLAWYDLFPLLSYIFLKGRCRYCKNWIGLEYVLVELCMGGLIALLFWLTFQNLQLTISSWQSIDNFQFINFVLDLVFKIFFITILVIVALTDIKKTLIPDRIIKPAILIAFLILTLATIYKVWYLYYFLSHDPFGKFLLPPNDYFIRHASIITESLIGAVLTGLGIGAFFMSLIIVTKGKGMGGGDVKLGVFMGLGLGFPLGVLALMLSFITGAMYSVILIILGKKKLKSAIPFGPFLVLGSLIALFWGQQIINWYLGLHI